MHFVFASKRGVSAALWLVLALATAHLWALRDRMSSSDTEPTARLAAAATSRFASARRFPRDETAPTNNARSTESPSSTPEPTERRPQTRRAATATLVRCGQHYS